MNEFCAFSFPLTRSRIKDSTPIVANYRQGEISTIKSLSLYITLH